MALESENTRHPDDALLWQYFRDELDAEALERIGRHLRQCAECRPRAIALTRIIGSLQEMHRQIQPDMAMQTRLIRHLGGRSRFSTPANMWAVESRRLLRWLAPGVAVLIALFIFLHKETSPFQDLLPNMMMNTPVARLALTQSEAQLNELLVELTVDNIKRNNEAYEK